MLGFFHTASIFHSVSLLFYNYIIVHFKPNQVRSSASGIAINVIDMYNATS